MAELLANLLQLGIVLLFAYIFAVVILNVIGGK